jgi:hypothetical protein
VFGAVVDAVGVAYDVTAAVVPLLPAGVSTVVKGRRLVAAAKALSRGTKLTGVMKTALRAQARRVFFKAYPLLAKAAKGLQIHHKIPLQYAHMFKNLDVNSINNLVGLNKKSHGIVSKAWAAFAKANPTPTAKQVADFSAEVMKLVK